MIENGRLRRPEPRLSASAEAAQARMIQTAKGLRKPWLGTPELLVAILEEPVVAGAFCDVGMPTERVMAALEWTFGQMTGVAPERVEPPKPRFSFLQKQRPSILEDYESREPHMSPALANVIRLAARDVQQEKGEEAEPIDWLQAMVQYEQGGTYQILTEELHIDKDAFLAAIERRRVLQKPITEARRIFGLGNEPLDEEAIARLSPVPPFPTYQDDPVQVYEEEIWGIERFREITSKWEVGVQAIAAQTILLKGEERVRAGKQLLAMELLPDNGGRLTEFLYRMSQLSDQALARMVLSMDTPPQPRTPPQP